MKQLLFGSTIAAVLVGTLSAGAPAYAAPSKDEAANTSSRQALEVTGFDRDVAEANGYRIEERDGEILSIPETPEATAKDAEAESRRLSLQGTEDASAQRGRVTVRGRCGSSSIEFSRSGNHVTVRTGYLVIRPVVNRINWAVQVWSTDGNPYFTWPNGPSPYYWEASAGFFNNVGGFGHVLTTSSVLLENGLVCSSGGPTSTI